MEGARRVITETDRATLYALCLVLAISLYAGLRVVGRSEKRFPDAPWLRLSDLPGSAGIKADAERFVANGHEVICVGYEMVRQDRREGAITNR